MTLDNLPPPEEGEDEIAALIKTLHETERRLEELTGGEVDTVSTGSGQPFLLRRAQVELRSSEAAKQAAILNALPAQIALLDAQGCIISVNEAWRQFASANFLQGPEYAVGVNYLEICDRAQGADSAEAAQVATGIRSVLAGAKKFSQEYPCHSPSERRWFLMTVSALTGAQAHGAVVMHLNITERRLAENRVRESEAAMAVAQQVGHFGSWEIEMAETGGPDGGKLRWSDEMFRIAGYEPGAIEISNDFFFSRVPAEEHAAIRQAVAGTMRERSSDSFVHRFVRADGEESYLQETVQIIVDDKTGRPVKIVGTAQDITARKRAEGIVAEMSSTAVRSRQSQALRDLVVLVAMTAAVYLLAARLDWFAGLARWALAANSERLNESIGATLFLIVGLTVFAVRRWYGTRTELTSHKNIRAALSLLHGELDRRVKQRTAELDKINQTLRTEIAERKQAEAALAALSEKTIQRERLLMTMLSHISDFTYIYDRQGRFLFANQSLLDLWGRTLDDIVGKNFFDLGYPAERAEKMQREVREVFATGRKCTGETIYTRPAGGDGYYEYIFSPVLAADGTVEFVVGSTREITDRKHAAEEIFRAHHTLQQQRSELQVLFDLTPAMIWFKDTANGFLRVNRRVAESTGLRIADIEGKSAYDIFPNEAAGYFADDLDVIRSGAPKLGIVEMLRGPNGQARWVQTDKVPVCDDQGKVTGLIAMVHDITERKEADDALRASEKRFRALFDQAAVGVAQADALTGRYLQVNQRYCDITGRSREELAQLTAKAITHPDYLSRDQERVSQMLAGTLRESTVEKRYLLKDLSEVWVQVTVAPMWAPGEPPDYFIAVAQDVTERKKLEEQLRQSQKMDAIGTLAGGIAHDFNNILAAINGYTELSKMRLTGNPEVLDYLGAVLKASSRATDLVRQILTFSRQQKVERRPIQLQPIVTEAFKLLRASIPSTIEFEISFKDAPTVLADATQIHQVLMNLGTNAWHAMKDRPGRLQVKLERQVVDASNAPAQARLQPGDYARLSVSDSGSGMDQATIKRIFEPFFTTKPIGEGTGLGLAVVHGIMATHEGAITVYSEPGEGTVFHLYFPAFAGSAAAAIEPGAVPRGHGEKILFVDDEELLVKLGEQTLTTLGYEVETTTQPAFALARVRADPQRFALVVTDQTMPGMTGVDLSRQLLQLRPGLPIILLTGYGLTLTSDGIKAMGIRHLLIKPTTIHSLGSAVHAALSSQSPR